jgi:hypothetical protein
LTELEYRGLVWIASLPEELTKTEFPAPKARLSGGTK